MTRLLEALPKSLEHATSRIKDEGKEAVDRLGLGLMHQSTDSLPDSSMRQRMFGKPEPDVEKGDRNPSIRFADDAPSSDTAPGNYGANNPGFRKNPSLSMFRSTSVESPSVSFQEPEKPRNA